MKKKLGAVLAVAATLTLSMAMAACGDAGYVVSFDTDFGSSIPAQYVTDGKVKAPDSPEREGYTFGGWYKDEACTEVFDFDKESIGKDTTVYAKWTANGGTAATYQVTYVENGGSTVEGTTVSAGELLTAPAAPTKAGYTFGGWYTDKALTTEYSFDAAVESDLILFAKWNAVVNEKNGFVFSEIAGENAYAVSAQAGYGFADKVTIPNVYNEKPVTRIGDMRALTAREVVIEGGVTVAEGAFMNNSSIEFVEIKGDYAILGTRAFMNSALKAIDLGKTIYVGASAFANTKLMTLAIPESCGFVGAKAFEADGLEEVGFAGDLPETLIGSAGGRDYYTSKSALDKLLGGQTYETEREWEEAAENAFLGLGFSASAEDPMGLHYLDDADMAEAIAYEGFYSGDDATIYLGLGEVAVVATDSSVASFDLYGYDSVFAFHANSNERDVYKLDNTSFTNKLLTPNAQGEVIEGNTLYDYVGNAIVYTVPETVVHVGAGAGLNNRALRFLEFGDSVEDIGSYAFATFIPNDIASGNLLGVSFGTGLKKIGFDAFFGQGTFVEIIFRGETAPEIGDGAFTYLEGMTQYSSVISSWYALNGLGDVRIWTPLSTSGGYDDDWNPLPAPCMPFVDAFNASLASHPVYDATIEGYKPQVLDEYYDFGQLSETGAFAKGAEYSADFGTLRMSGTSSRYVLVEFAEDGDYEGMGYAYVGDMVGYPQDTDAKHITVFTSYDAAGIENFDFYGALNTKNNTITLRGAEAGSYGDVEKDLYVLDGYGKVTRYSIDGSTAVGSYTMDGNKLTVTGIDGFAEATFDVAAGKITVADQTLEKRGEEAGIYRDLANAATIMLNGVPYTDESGDKPVYYAGTLTLDYNGKKTSGKYYFEKNTLYVTLGSTKYNFTYSRTSDVVLSGYLDPDNYEGSAKFCVAESRLAGTYTSGSDSVTLDGYYTLTKGDKKYSYAVIGDAGIFYFEDKVCNILHLNETEHTYAAATEEEAGMYYVSASAKYRLYLDGQGALVYFDGENKTGTYTYDKATKAIHTSIGAEETAEGLDGTLDLENGVGYIVYSYSGETYVGISTEDFAGKDSGYGFSYTSYYLTAYDFYLDEDGNVAYSSKSLTVKLSNGYIFVSEYGMPFLLMKCDAEVQDGNLPSGTKLAFTYAYNNNGEDRSLALTMTITVDDYGNYSALTAVKYASEDVIETENGTYQFVWLNDKKTLAGILSQVDTAYPSVVYQGSVTWDGTTMTAGKIDMTEGNFEGIILYGYGTDDVEIFHNTKRMSYQDAEKAEFKYNRINIYSRDKLWVGNQNIDGAVPELADYTTEVKEDVTYYTFTSVASGKVVTFHIVEGEFVVDSEVDPA